LGLNTCSDSVSAGRFSRRYAKWLAGHAGERSPALFIPEFLSMSLLMTGMIPIVALGRKLIGAPSSPLAPVMSMALLTGFVTAHPMNWLGDLKHGMMTVRPGAAAETRGMTAATPTVGGAPAMPMNMASPHCNDWNISRLRRRCKLPAWRRFQSSRLGWRSGSRSCSAATNDLRPRTSATMTIFVAWHRHSLSGARRSKETAFVLPTIPACSASAYAADR
jgi:hypothetical protein